MSLGIQKTVQTAIIITALSGVIQPIHAGPVGQPFTVNTHLPDHQILWGTAAASANGDQIVLWSDYERTTSFIQRYNVAGQAFFAQEMNLNYPADSVAMDRVGNYLITSTVPDGSEEGIFATIYDRFGNIRINTFRVNDNIVGRQLGGAIAMHGNGNFAVTYLASEAGKWNTYVRQYYANGIARGPATKLNVNVSPDTFALYPGALAVDASGNVVVGGVAVTAGTEMDVWMRRVSSHGVLLGSQTTVNTHTINTQSDVSIAMDSSNNFIIVWTSYRQDGNGWSLYGQRFNSDGSRFGGPFPISQTLSDAAMTPSIGVMDDGSFAVAWPLDRRTILPSSLPAVYTRQFRADLTPVTGETLVSTIPGSMAFFTWMAMDAAGNYLIAWRDYNTAGNYDVAARRYVMDTLPPVIMLTNGQMISGISGATGSWKYFKIRIPAGTTTLNVNMSGAPSGDGDLYIRFGAIPTLTKWDIRPYLVGNNESVSISNPPAGDFYFGIHGYSGYPSISLMTTYY